MEQRIGIGFDVHAFAENRDLILGSIKIPHTRGLAGHSDADVLLHAVCDAMLGALALGDIGRHFPDNDAQYKDIPSTQLLEKTYDMVRQEGYE
ncbi:MAG: 2-C-methyl-D-erythritol 2,4-cyclodiphosphate synthase, partial [Calditrichaeota bacterium]